MEVTAFEVADGTRVGEARRAAAQAARVLGFSEVQAGRIAIAVTELGTNLVKHAGGGHLLLHPVGWGGPGLEILALDRGPGIRNVALSLEDGFSTSGTQGTGLGAVRRLADDFDIFTRAESGTAVLARFFVTEGLRAELPLRVGAVTVPKPGETVCGDGFAVMPTDTGLRVLVVDGLGHGPLAREASAAATAAFTEAPTAPLAALETCHLALRATRGAAAAVAEIDLVTRQLRFAGLGNITGMVTSATGQYSLVSWNGIVGQGPFRSREQGVAWPAGASLVMCSDGITTRWNLASYPGLLARDPALTAGVVFRDHTRTRDDSTVVVIQEAAA